MKKIINTTNEVVTMTSLEVVELINNFRKEEGNETLKKHDDMLKSIRKEIEVLKNAGIEDDGNFSETLYKDSYNRDKPCYKLNKAGVMQMLNKESALVRYKTQQYIEALENRLKQESYQNLSTEMKAILMHDVKIQKLESKVNVLYDTTTIDYAQQAYLRELANKRVVEVLGGKKSIAYTELSKKVFAAFWKDYKRYFRVNSYRNTAKKDCKIASEYIESWIPSLNIAEELNFLDNQTVYI